MTKNTDIKNKDLNLFFLPAVMRVPLKFGPEVTTSVTCARVHLLVEDRTGRSAWGWGETPLMVQWVWVSSLSYEDRHQALKNFTLQLAAAWKDFPLCGHPMEISHAFQQEVLPALLQDFNKGRGEEMPWLAALVCCSLFDIALHDAFGQLQQVSVYETYGPEYMNRDLAGYLEPAEGASVSFDGRYPEDFLVRPAPQRIPAWHLIGGKDLIDRSELTGQEPADGHPLLLRDWIERDGLNCLKVKLKGDDPAWDYARFTQVGRIAVDMGVQWLTADFNCQVQDPVYVIEILDRLLAEEPRIYGMLLYVEQPFPYDLENNQIDVHGVSARKPLFMDESAHDWHLVRLGRSLGWTGVALKTCKTQTGALLSLSWAKAHGMTLMVQDLTNPMLAMIPHALLAAHAGTIMGVETNSSQFYPAASEPEAAVHPGIYRRHNGSIDLSTLGPTGFGYRQEEMQRKLPDPEKLNEQRKELN